IIPVVFYRLSGCASEIAGLEAQAIIRGECDFPIRGIVRSTGPSIPFLSSQSGRTGLSLRTAVVCIVIVLLVFSFRSEAGAVPVVFEADPYHFPGGDYFYFVGAAIAQSEVESVLVIYSRIQIIV